jgi:hypothetical protein
LGTTPSTVSRRYVSRDDLFVQVRCHPARACVDVYGSAVNEGDEAGRKARCGSVFETRTARIDQHDAAVTPACSTFDKLTERFEYSRHRMAARYHFEQSLFTGEQSFSPLPVVDISVQEIPNDDTPFRISQGQAAHVEPAVDSVSAAEAGLRFVGMAGFERLPPPGEGIWAVFRMKAVAGRPTFQFFERRAEIFQDLAVDEFELAGRRHESAEGRNAVVDRTKMMLALRRPKPPRRMLGFLRPPSALDIDVHPAPFDDTAGCVD